MTEIIIHEVDRWTVRRYRVESVRDAGGYRYETRLETDDRQTAISHAEKLVHESEHYAARVVDTKRDEDER